jgi:hypothetical protein
MVLNEGTRRGDTVDHDRRGKGVLFPPEDAAAFADDALPGWRLSSPVTVDQWGRRVSTQSRANGANDEDRLTRRLHRLCTSRGYLDGFGLNGWYLSFFPVAGSYRTPGLDTDS